MFVPGFPGILIHQEQVYNGTFACRGCGWALLVRYVANIMGPKTVYVVPASCYSIIAGGFPFNSPKANVFHIIFAAAAAGATGVRHGLNIRGDTDANVVVLAGDGGTFDIGIQALSGAASRNEDIIFITNNNGAYMNTGIQTSSATPYGAITTTNPPASPKLTWPKDLMSIIASHNIPYAATVSPAFPEDMIKKLEKAKRIKGFRYIMADGMCPPGHKVAPEMALHVARLNVETRLFPLFEVEDGHKYTITYKPKEFVPVEEALKPQGRFRSIFKSPDAKQKIEYIQRQVDGYWEYLLKREECGF